LIYVLVFTFRGGTSKCLLQLSFLNKNSIPGRATEEVWEAED